MLPRLDSIYTAESFLAEEADAWAPFDVLADVPDAVLERAGDPGGPLEGASGRDLLVEMTQDQESLAEMARELQVSETSRTLGRLVFIWTEIGAAAMARETKLRWQDTPMAEIRRRFRESEATLRRELARVPEERWTRDAFHLGLFWMDTIKACEFRRPRLDAVLRASAAVEAEP